MTIIRQTSNLVGCIAGSLLRFSPVGYSQEAIKLDSDEATTLAHASESLEIGVEVSRSLNSVPMDELQISEAVFQREIELVERLYSMESSPKELIAFFYEHLELTLSLGSIYHGLRRFFPGRFSLDLLLPGEDASEPQLVLRISTHLSARDARQALKSFREDWRKHNYRNSFRDLTISFSFG